MVVLTGPVVDYNVATRFVILSEESHKSWSCRTEEDSPYDSGAIFALVAVKTYDIDILLSNEGKRWLALIRCGVTAEHLADVGAYDTEHQATEACLWYLANDVNDFSARLDSFQLKQLKNFNAWDDSEQEFIA